MKKTVLSILTCLAIGSWANAQNVNIPDANFKNALLDQGVGITGAGISVIDTNNDGEIQVSEAQAYTGTIKVANQMISDLTGIEAFVNLTELLCYNTQLTSLDISANTALVLLQCSNSLLTDLNVANGNNANFSAMFATGNSNLTCIQHDIGFDPTTNSSWTKDGTASWSTNCGGSTCANIVNIPDANFKNILINQYNLDTDGDNEICESEALAHNSFITAMNASITDLTGIEAFQNITALTVRGNQITTLDLSQNTALTSVDCRNNALTSLNVSQCSQLVEIDCRNNQLSNLDVSQNTQLIFLFASDNNISTIDVSANTSLTELNLRENSITAIDVSQNTLLELLYLMNNQVSTLDLSSNSALETVFVNGNSLTELNLANGNNTILTTVRANINPNLTCIQHDTGFTPPPSTTYSGWRKDATASWSDNCGGVLVSTITVQGQGGASTIATPAGTLQMEATVLPANADDMTYTWSVTNGTGMATIDANGVLTASADGTVDVIATANDGSGVTGSTTVTISNQSASINENNISFSIVPNPTSGIVKIDTDVEINSVEIFSTSGQQVASFETKAFDISALQSGVYFVKVLSDSGLFTTRIIRE